MHEINGSTAINGHFVDGTSSQGGTIVSADWLNTVQDEICNLITSTGIQLNNPGNDDRKQLTGAIGKITSNLASKSDISSFVSKSDLTGYATKSDLSTFAAKSDLDLLNNYMQWCVSWIEHLSGKKYPELPN